MNNSLRSGTRCTPFLGDPPPILLLFGELSAECDEPPPSLHRDTPLPPPPAGLPVSFRKERSSSLEGEGRGDSSACELLYSRLCSEEACQHEEKHVMTI
jgi:hypothetical protein